VTGKVIDIVSVRVPVVHALAPFTKGMHLGHRTRCGVREQGDTAVDVVTVSGKAAVTCDRCKALLAREDERAPMGDGKQP